MNFQIRVGKLVYSLSNVETAGQPSGKNVKPHLTCNTRINSRWVMDLIVLVIKIILRKTMCLQRKIFIYISQ